LVQQSPGSSPGRTTPIDRNPCKSKIYEGFFISEYGIRYNN
jgi:hypothetical protein